MPGAEIVDQRIARRAYQMLECSKPGEVRRAGPDLFENAASKDELKVVVSDPSDESG
jgi:hypothetical protein